MPESLLLLFVCYPLFCILSMCFDHCPTTFGAAGVISSKAALAGSICQLCWVCVLYLFRVSPRRYNKELRYSFVPASYSELALAALQGQRMATQGAPKRMKARL
jgi:hypothetical protein